MEDKSSLLLSTGSVISEGQTGLFPSQFIRVLNFVESTSKSQVSGPSTEDIKAVLCPV